jgi:hypothetical protein
MRLATKRDVSIFEMSDVHLSNRCPTFDVLVSATMAMAIADAFRLSLSLSLSLSLFSDK